MSEEMYPGPPEHHREYRERDSDCSKQPRVSCQLHVAAVIRLNKLSREEILLGSARTHM